jgi:hypothetical protein
MRNFLFFRKSCHNKKNFFPLSIRIINNVVRLRYFYTTRESSDGETLKLCAFKNEIAYNFNAHDDHHEMCIQEMENLEMKIEV